VADDLVARQFRPERPDVLWIADLTYLRNNSTPVLAVVSERLGHQPLPNAVKVAKQRLHGRRLRSGSALE